jgi:hypothetical protein
MQVAKWWHTLAVKLRKQGGASILGTANDREREEALARMRDRGWEAPGYGFDREAANER